MTYFLFLFSISPLLISKAQAGIDKTSSSEKILQLFQQENNCKEENPDKDQFQTAMEKENIVIDKSFIYDSDTNRFIFMNTSGKDPFQNAMEKENIDIYGSLIYEPDTNKIISMNNFRKKDCGKKEISTLKNFVDSFTIGTNFKYLSHLYFLGNLFKSFFK